MGSTAVQASSRFGGLSSLSATILVAILIVGFIHHTDHVLRFDHSGWPFRPEVNPFTFSLLAYPILLSRCSDPRGYSGYGGYSCWWGRVLRFGRIP